MKKVKTFMKKVKEFFKDNCKTFLILLGVAVAIGGIFFLSKLGQDKYFKEMTYEQYATLSNNNFVYFGSEKDYATLETLKSFAEEHELKFKYVYTDKLTDEQKEEVLGEDESAFYYGEEGVTGEITEATVQQFLIDQDVLPQTYLKINMTDYKKLMKEDTFVVVIGRNGCSFCTKYQPVMNKIIEEHDIMMYYVDIYEFSQEDYNELIKTASYLSENEWGTPLTLVFKKGKFVDAFSGYAEKPTIVNFLKEVGVINED